MDKSQWTKFILFSVPIVALWLGFNLWYEKHYPPLPPVPAATEAATTAPTSASAPTTSVAATSPSTEPSTQTARMTVGVHVAPTTQPAETVSLGSGVPNDPTYAIQVNLQSTGAAVADVVLNDFNGPKKNPKDPKTIYRFESPFPGLDASAALATRTLFIDDKPIDLVSVPWTLVSSDSLSAVFSVTILDGDNVPVLEVRKKYSIQPRAAADGSQGFEIALEQTIKNLRPDRTFRVRSTLNGPTPPPSEQDNGSDRMVVVGYRESTTSIVQRAFLDGEFNRDTTQKDLTKDVNDPFVWVAQANAYFAAIVLPGPEAKAGDSGLTVRADALDPTAEVDRKVALTLDTPEVKINGGETSSLPMSVYLGPKWRQVLNNEKGHYVAYPRMYDKMLGARYQSRSSWMLFTFLGSMCQSCQWQWLIITLVWILDKFHLVLRDWGLAIICLVLCVRALLHPLTKQSQVRMMAMSKMAPEVEKLKKKYADDPDQLNKEMMKIYQGQIGAMFGCLPMFLQTPIWIALWAALQGTFELRQAPFLRVFGHDLTWIHDLSRPDSLIHFGGPVRIFFFTIYSINLLPLLMAVVTYINQAYFMPTPIAATPEQEQQQKMQRGMSLIVPLMFYSFPSGLSLYYLTSTGLGIIESKIIRDHIKEREELAKAEAPELVATKASRSARKHGKVEPEKEKPGFFARMFTPLMEAMHKAQEQAEQLRKEQNKGKKK